MRSAHLSLLLLILTGLAVTNAAAAGNLLGDGSFESGLDAPWGKGQYAAGHSVWWNTQGCASRADIDEAASVEGLVSLHIINPSTRAPQVYGTTVQQIPIKANHPYRISVWAQGLNLASKGAVTIIVDDAWRVRPIVLPAGNFAWTRLSATFSLPADHASIRILSEDKGEAWLDDLEITPLDSTLY